MVNVDKMVTKLNPLLILTRELIIVTKCFGFPHPSTSTVLLFYLFIPVHVNIS